MKHGEMEKGLKNDLVSVVIPCFNVADYVEDCIRSVYDQYVETQVICVDNNSTDGTFSKLVQIQKLYPEILILEEKRKGASYARNLGLTVAEGKYIQFLDADDRLKKGKLVHQVGAIGNAAAIVSPYTRKRDAIETSVYPDSNPWKGLFTTRLGITSSALFKTSDVKTIGGWNASLSSSQEYDLMFRLMKSGREILVDDQLLTLVLDRPSGQISTSDPRARWLNYLNLRKDIFEELSLNRKDVFQKYESFYYQSFFDTIHIAYPHCPEEATMCYKKYIKGKYSIQTSPATGRFFHSLMKIGGFEFAEKIKSLVKS